MKRRTGTGRWRWALMLPVLVFLLGESSGQREEGRSPRLPAQARYEQAVENALRSDDADKIDHALLICAPRLPPPLQEDLQRAVDDFDFRRAEATLRDWQANHPR